MKSATLSIVITCVPALLLAQQASGTSSASAAARADASANASVTIPASYSTESRATIDAAFKAARAKALPEQPMQQRMAEGQTKGASDAQIAAAVSQVEARLEASQAAMVNAGRQKPSADEVTNGERAMERGVTEAQLSAIAQHAQPDRSLTVAFDVLAKLTARGEPVSQAVAAVQSKLAAGATDDALIAIAGHANASGSPQKSGSDAAAKPAAAVSGSVGATAKGAVNAAAGVTGAVSGAVSGAVGPKKP